MKLNSLLLCLFIGVCTVTNAQKVRLTSNKFVKTSTSVSDSGNNIAYSYSTTFSKKQWKAIKSIIQKEYPNFDGQLSTEKNNDFEYRIDLKKTGLQLAYKSQNQSADKNKNQSKLEAIADQVNTLKDAKE